MGALASWLLSAFGTAVGYSAVRFGAWKLVIWTITITVVPIIITNAIYSLVNGAMTLQGEFATSSNLQAYIYRLSGLAGFLASALRLPEGISIIMSAVIFRLAIKMIPFIRL